MINNIVLIFFVALFGFIYVDYLSLTEIGTYVSLLIFIVVILISISRLDVGIVLVLFLSFYISEFPRNIVDNYNEIQISKTVAYNVLSTVSLSSFTLINLLFLFNSMLSVFYLYKNSVRFKFVSFVPISLFFVIGAISFFYGYILLDAEVGRSIISDMKFPIFIILGFFQGVYLVAKGRCHLVYSLFLIYPLFSGLRVLFFIVSDINLSQINFYFMANTTISLVVLAYVIVSRESTIYDKLRYRFLLYVSLLEPSRSVIVFIFLVLISSTLLSLFFPGKSKSGRKVIVEFSSVAMGVLTVMALFVPEAFLFMLWKLNVFGELFNSSTQLSGSGTLRLLELKNIFYENTLDVFRFLFGKGFGGTYLFREFTLDGLPPLDLKSFSKDQLESNVYYTTHSFSSHMLLKFGVVGLLSYVAIPLFLINKFFKLSKSDFRYFIFFCFFNSHGL